MLFVSFTSEYCSKMLILPYRIVLHLCDTLDRAKELFDYFKATMNTYIDEILPNLKSKKDELLLKEFVK